MPFARIRATTRRIDGQRDGERHATWAAFADAAGGQRRAARGARRQKKSALRALPRGTGRRGALWPSHLLLRRVRDWW